MFSPFARYGIDEKAARIVAALVGILAAATSYLPASLQFPAMVLLVADVSARAFSRPELSLFTNVARRALWLFSVPPRRVDAAPKRFAARIGLVLVGTMALSSATGSRLVLLVSSMLLALLALLEATLNVSTALWNWTRQARPVGVDGSRGRLRAG